MPPTRATRQQRKAAGTEASPFQSLDSAPPRTRTTRKKAPGKENEKTIHQKNAEPRRKTGIPVPRKDLERSQTKDASKGHKDEAEKDQSRREGNKEPSNAPTKVTALKAHASTGKAPQLVAVEVQVQVPEKKSSMHPNNFLYTTPSPSPTPIETSPSSPISPLPITPIRPTISQFHSIARSSIIPYVPSPPHDNVKSLARENGLGKRCLVPSHGDKKIVVMFWDAPKHGPAVRYHVAVPRLTFHEFLTINLQNCRSYGIEHPALRVNDNTESRADENQAENVQRIAPSNIAKPRVSRLKRALDKKKAEEQEREDNLRDASERARQKAIKAKAQASSARASAAARARDGGFDSSSLMRGSRSPSPQRTPRRSPEDDLTAASHAGNADFDQHANFSQHVASILPQTPIRNWGFGSVVSQTVGRLNPFSLFGRQTPAPRARTAPSSPVPQPQTNEPAPAAASSTDDDAMESMSPQPTVGASSSDPNFSALNSESVDVAPKQKVRSAGNQEQALVLASSDDAEQQLLEYIAKTYPSLANSETVENLKTTLRQYEILEKHRENKSHSVQKRRIQTTPDVSPVAGAKRKRKSRPSPEVIPNPPGCSYGMDMAYFSDSSSENDSDVEQSEDSVAELTPPSKKQRLTPPKSVSNPLGMSRELQRRLEARAERRKRLLLGHPNKPEPYIGNIFAEPKQNIFQDWEHFPATFTPMSPATTGQFTVPDSSSSEEEDNVDATAPSLTTPARQSAKRVCFSSEEDSSDAEPRGNSNTLQGTPRSILKGSATYNQGSQGQPASQDGGPIQQQTQDQSQPQAPPPAPTPSHATLPAAQIPNAPAAASGDALAHARAQANKYAPKVSSNLRESHRLSNSPLLANGTLPPGANLFAQQSPLVNGASSDSDEAIMFQQPSTVPGSFKDWPKKLSNGTGIDPFAGLEIDPIVADALAGLGDGLIPDTLADFDISEEVFKILNYTN